MSAKLRLPFLQGDSTETNFCIGASFAALEVKHMKQSMEFF
jgi:hypothetical protein